MPDFIPQFKSQLPETNWPWTLAALRQDGTIWESLHEAEFCRKTLTHAGAQAKRWTPAQLGLLLIQSPYSPDEIQNPDFDPDPAVRGRAQAALESASKNPGDSASLEEATWLALGLRGLWNKGKEQALAAITSSGSKLWKTAAACLYGMLPEPETLLGATVAPGTSKETRQLGLHAYFSNPAPFEEQAESLGRILAGYPILEQAAILKMAAEMQPQVAKGAAATLAAKRDEASETKSEIEKAIDNIGEFELRIMSGEFDMCLPLLEDAQEAFAQNQSKLASQLATAAIEGGAKDTASRAIGKALPENGAAEAHTLLALAKIDPSLARAKTIREGQESSAEAALLAARLAVGQGDLLEAQSKAVHLLESLRRNEPAELVAGLAETLLEAGLPAEAGKAAKVGLGERPNQLRLLEILRKSQVENDEIQESIETSHLAVALAPANLETRRELAKALAKGKQYRQAVEELEKVIDRGEAPKVEDLLALGSYALQCDDVKRAMAAGQKSIDFDPQNGRAFSLFGQAQEKGGDEDGAAGSYQKATELSPQLAEAWLRLAALHSAKGEAEKALNILQEAVELADESPQIHLALGKAYLAQDKHAQAMGALQYASKLAQADEREKGTISAPFALELGQTLYEFDLHEQALEVLNEAHQAQSSDGDIAHAYAKTLLALDQPGAALPALAIARQAYPDRTEAHLDYAKAHLALDRHAEEALTAAQTALKLEPENGEALALYAEASAKTGDLDSAIEAYQRALESEVGRSPAWNLRLCKGLGEAAIRHGQPEIAVAALQEARQLVGEDVSLMRALSEAYLASALPKDARETALAVRELAPNDVDSSLWFAEQAVQWNSPKEAVAALKEAAKLAPERTDILVRMGYIHLQTGRTDSAQEAFEQIYDSKQADPEDLFQAAQAFKSLQQTDAHLRFLERAQQRSVKANPHLLEELQAAYQATGRYEAALEIVERQIALAPDEVQLVIQKTDLLQRLGRPQEALASIEKALEGEPENTELQLRAAALHFEAGELKPAWQHAQAAVEADSGNPAAHYLAAEIARVNLLDEEARRLLAAIDWGGMLQNGATEDYVTEAICLLAEIELARGEEIPAAEHVAPLLESKVDCPRVSALAARLSERQGDHSQALGHTENALSQSEKDEEELAHIKAIHQLSVAEAALDNKQWDLALERLQTTIASMPKSPLSHLSLARAIVLRAEQQRLSQNLEVQHHAPGHEALEDEARIRFEGAIENALQHASFEDAEKAIRHWQRRGAWAFRPSKALTEAAPAQFESAEETASFMAAARTAGDTAAAIKAAEQYPEHTAVLAQTALALTKEHPQEALDMAHQAAERLPSNPLMHGLVAYLARRAGDNIATLASIRRALAYWPEEARWQALAGRLEYESGNAPTAVKHLEQATLLEGNHAPHLVTLGKAYLKSNLPGNAIRVLEEAGQLTPKDAEIWLTMAQAKLDSKEVKQAEECAEKAVKLAPNQIEPLMLCAKIAIQNGQSKRAQRFSQAALKLRPKDTDALMLSAKVLQSLDQAPEAIAALEEAAAQVDNPLPLELEKAHLIRNISGPEGEREALEALAEKYPGEPQIFAAMAQAYAEAGETEAAIEAAQEALGKGTEGLGNEARGELHFLLGKLQHQSGQLDQALHQLGEAIKARPSFMDAYLEMGHVHKKRREHQQAIASYRSATEAAPHDPRPYLEVALALKEGKDYAGAEANLRRASALAPDDIFIQRQLGTIVALNLVHKPLEAGVPA